MQLCMYLISDESGRAPSVVRLDRLSDPLILIRWCQCTQSTVLCHGVPTGNTVSQHYICGLSLQDKATDSWKFHLNSFHKDYFFHKNSSNKNCSQWCLWIILSMTEALIVERLAEAKHTVVEEVFISVIYIKVVIPQIKNIPLQESGEWPL